ncbi:uncharacterized protein [Amphiura filiformis]|uniref:uncharacterized protein n=1 Tax=Amphiura filiformis TaxID=82378 RepID=UPI003B216E0E
MALMSMTLSFRSSSDKSFWARQSRGRAVVNRERQRTSRSNSKVDVLETASALGIQIKHVKLVLEWIDNIKKEQLRRNNTSSSGSRLPKRQLRGQCKKVENALW